MSYDDDFAKAGWVRDDHGVWTNPASPTVDELHVHSPVCTAESCGPDAMFMCGPVCIRAMRSRYRDAATVDEVMRMPCEGHRVPTRDRLIQYSLEHKQLKAPAPAGTPLEDDDDTNTWSNERNEIAGGRQ